MIVVIGLIVGCAAYQGSKAIAIETAGTVSVEAAPAAVVGGLGHAGAEGVGLDEAEDGKQGVVVLDDGTLEPSLPDVAAAAAAGPEVAKL